MGIFNESKSDSKKPENPIDWEEQLKELDAELANNPNDGKTILLKGHVLEILGRYEEALSCFNYLLANPPSKTQRWKVEDHIGRDLIRLNREEEALIWLERALEEEPNQVNLLNDISVIHFKAGRFEESKVYCEKLLKIAPNDDLALTTGIRLDLINKELAKR